ncbi:MAG TPA: hypothetical protein VN493_26625 [Thermoanaerobaculia bacterium]|nr:hypothetical protein [Thermoanaerobaculia bacterium]
MIVEESWLQLVLALAGGLAAELLHWYGLARKPGGVKPYQKRTLYWITTLGMIVLGGLMPVLYISGAAHALLCFHLGAATPLLLQKLVSAAPPSAQPMGAARGGPSLREFFRW